MIGKIDYPLNENNTLSGRTPLAERSGFPTGSLGDLAAVRGWQNFAQISPTRVQVIP